MAKFNIDNWVDDHLDRVKVSGGGDEREALCPACGKHGSFYVKVSGDRSGSYICFSCDFRGRNPTGLIAEVEGISRSEALRRLMKGIVDFKRIEPETLLERIKGMRGELEDEESELAVDVPLPEEYIPVFNKKLGKWRFPAYLAKRGMKKETALELGIGYCRTGAYKQRIVFPIVCPNGRSFTARDVTDEQIPRYRNPTGAGLGRLLYGWSTLKDYGDFLVVEGPMDAAMAYQNGYPVVALCGKNFGEDQKRMLRSKSLGAAIVMLDPEEGLAPVKVAQALLEVVEDVYVAELPEGKDPGDATKVELDRAYDESKPFSGARVSRAIGALRDSRRKMNKRFGKK